MVVGSVEGGGATNKGVTIATFRRYVKPGGSVSDLKRITNDQVAIVYKRHYWDRVSGDELPSGVDYTVFDFGINSGPGRSIRYLQKAVGVARDGVIGPATLEAVRNANASDLIRKICQMRLAYMRRIRGGKLWAKFGRGWQNRVNDVRMHSLAIVGRKSVLVQVPPSRYRIDKYPVDGGRELLENSEDIEYAIAHLRKDGSRTLRAGDIQQGVSVVLGSAGTGLYYFQEVQGALAGLPKWVLPVILVVGLVAVFWCARSIKRARVEDHMTGKHIGRLEPEESTGGEV